MTFSSDSLAVADEEKVPTSSHKVSDEKLAQIIKRAEAGHATHGAIKRLKEGRLTEALTWLRGCCMFDLAREVEGVISGGTA
jgi:hypothetical protein